MTLCESAIGMATTPRKPRRLACSVRRFTVSSERSGTQINSLSRNARPGMPWPGAKRRRGVASSNRNACWERCGAAGGAALRAQHVVGVDAGEVAGEPAGAVQRIGGVAAAGERGHAEVEDFHAAVATQHDVLGLDVAMNDPRLVRRGERARYAQRNLDGLGEWQRPAREAVPQRLALDVFAGDEVHAVVDADVEDGDDVRVVEHRRALRLALESLELARRGIAEAKELERDFAPQHAVLGEVDVGRCSTSKVLENPVATDLQYIHRGLRDLQVCCRRMEESVSWLTPRSREH